MTQTKTEQNMKLSGIISMLAVAVLIGAKIWDHADFFSLLQMDFSFFIGDPD
jgi:hypothetical protein